MRSIRFLAVVGPAAILAAFLACGAASGAEESLTPALRGLSPSHLRIVGGMETNVAEWPWQLLLRIPRAQRGVVGYCGASLIARRWVLTAAHCFGAGYDRAQPIEVFEGLTYRDARGEEIYKKAHLVERPIIHPSYNNRNQENDIALLHLSEDAVSQSVEPLADADPSLESPPSRGIATGWGALTRIDQRRGGPMIDYKTKQPISEHGLVLPHGLMEVELPLVDVHQCKIANKDAGVVTDRNLCAGAPNGGKDTCKGDSGGPLVVETAKGGFVQIGVTSWGQGCGESDHPGVYTRVSAYADWIRTATKDAVAASAPSKPMAPAKPTEPAKPSEPAKPTEPAPALAPQYDNSAGLDVKLVAVAQGAPTILDTSAVKPGSQVAIVVATQKPGYLIILDETPDGKLTQIYPNGFSSPALPGDRQQANKLAAGKKITVPDPRNPYAGFAYMVDKTLGDGMISVLESNEPLASVDLESKGTKTFASREESRIYLANLSRELSRSFQPKGGSGDVPQYSAVYLPYTVKQ